MTRDRKEMEYPDAPSGYVMLYNYKEPFMKYEGGHGYQGVLLFDGETDRIQCHLCGEWFGNLSHHLHREHAMKAAEYKNMTGLLQTTALLNETERAVLIAKGVERFKNLRPNRHHTEATREKIRTTTLANRENRERQNITGTCPEQLIERLRTTYHKLGRTPHDAELKGKETFVKVFGSFKAACELAGIPYNPPGKTHMTRTSKYIRADMVIWVRENIVDGKFPKMPGYARAIGGSHQGIHNACKKWGGWKAICHEAVVSDGVYKKVRGYRYSKDELLNFLVEFKKNNGRNPSISDCKRGLLPHASRYIYYWKSWKGALKESGL